MAAAESLTITRGIDDKVKDIDHKAGLIIDGESCHINTPNWSSALASRCKRNWSSGATSGQSLHRSTEFVVV